MRSPLLTFAESLRLAALFAAMLLLFLLGLDLLIAVEGIGDTLRTIVPWRAVSTIPLTSYILLCLILMLLPVLYVALARWSSQLEKGIIGKGADGEVFFLRPASVQPVLAGRVKAHVPGVLSIKRCRVVQGAFSPRVSIHAAVDPGADLPEVQQLIRAEVRRCLRQLLGSENAAISVRFSTVLAREAKERRPADSPRRRRPDSPPELPAP